MAPQLQQQQQAEKKQSNNTNNNNKFTKGQKQKNMFGSLLEPSIKVCAYQDGHNELNPRPVCPSITSSFSTCL